MNSFFSPLATTETNGIEFSTTLKRTFCDPYRVIFVVNFGRSKTQLHKVLMVFVTCNHVALKKNNNKKQLCVVFTAAHTLYYSENVDIAVRDRHYIIGCVTVFMRRKKAEILFCGKRNFGHNFRRVSKKSMRD